MDLKRRFGQAVKSTRRHKGFSQEDLAVRIGADQAYISRIEAGQVNITLDTLELIASALGVEAVTLIPSSKV
jgi:transcriptional regulator with XRE-family HTH domain